MSKAMHLFFLSYKSAFKIRTALNILISLNNDIYFKIIFKYVLYIVSFTDFIIVTFMTYYFKFYEFKYLKV